MHLFIEMYVIYACRFGLKSFLMTPIPNPQGNGENQYNVAHKKTRVVIERCFGLTKQRFRCLHKSGGSLTYSPKKCCKIVMACLILHNMCVEANIPLDDEALQDDDNDDDGNVDSSDSDEGDDEDDINLAGDGADYVQQPATPRNQRAMRQDGWRVRQGLVQRFAQ